MATQRDHYEVLGIGRSATAEEIRKAYRRLARKLHPDVNKEADAAAKFAEVQTAYDVLSDAEKRKSYDQFGHAGVGGGFDPRSYGQGSGRGPFRTTWSSGGGSGEDMGDFASVFEELFRGGPGGMRGGDPFAGVGGGSRASARRQRPARGDDQHRPLIVSFMTAALGGKEQVRFTTATGETETIDVKIPAGINTGAKLRVKGRGTAGAGEAGDLILDVEVGKHPWLRREGLDVLMDVPITVVEAVRGTTATVPLLVKGSVDIRVPAGTSSGAKLRVKGRGITDSKGKQGDFYAVVQIVAPAGLSEAGLAAMETLAGELKNPRESAPWADVVRSRKDE